MIEDWIDALCDVFGGIAVSDFGSMKAPHMIKKTEFPSSINPTDDFPIALVIPASVELNYSAGGVKEGHWVGVTEIHLTPDLTKGSLPSILPYFGRIWVKCAANLQLGGLVENFIVTDIQGPMALQFGNEAEHWGLIVNWKVKEKVPGTTVIVAP